MEEPESDEALAQRLQEQLDREAEGQDVVVMDDRGLFFCQLCHKDLSAMSPQLRAQHINRYYSQLSLMMLKHSCVF